MKLSDWSKNLVKAIEELNLTRDKDAQLSVREGLALVKLRVPNTGVRADGQRFSDYSDNPIPFWWIGSSYVKPPDFNVANAKAKAKKEAKKEGRDFVSYKFWRESVGRPVGFKNFSFTGDMWASIREFIVSKTKTSVLIEVKSSYPLYNDTVIPAHSNREGINILQMAPSERKLVFQAYTLRRQAILRKNHIIK